MGQPLWGIPTALLLLPQPLCEGFGVRWALLTPVGVWRAGTVTNALCSSLSTEHITPQH